MDPSLTLMLEELKTVPLSELRQMLDENTGEHEALRAEGLGPGDDEFDQNAMLYVLLTSALEQRAVYN